MIQLALIMDSTDLQYILFDMSCNLNQLKKSTANTTTMIEQFKMQITVLPDASFSLQVLSSPASVYVCVSVFVCVFVCVSVCVSITCLSARQIGTHSS